MTSGIDYALYDVFTDTALTGNPLAVVFNADGLDTERMQAIAGEFNLSETIFILQPQAAMHAARVRIFTPKRELPFAGHPTVGAVIALAERDFDDGPTDRMLMLEEAIGTVRCVVRGGQPHYAEFDLPRLPEAVPEGLERSLLADALGLSEAQIGFENHKPTIWTAGNAFACVPVDGLSAMANIRIDVAALEDALPRVEGHIVELFVYCRETVFHDCAFHARMFAPHMGIPEDPATGSAVAAFAGAIGAHDGFLDGPNVFWIEQGIEMGRPSRIRLEVTVQQGALASARIGGHAVCVARGRLLV